MPMKSQQQRKYLWATDPKLARKFEDHTPKGKKLPKKVKEKKAMLKVAEGIFVKESSTTMGLTKRILRGGKQRMNKIISGGGDDLAARLAAASERMSKSLSRASTHTPGGRGKSLIDAGSLKLNPQDLFKANLKPSFKLPAGSALA